jgi:hypothetical protein
MNFQTAGTAAANGLIRTAELAEMIEQSNLFMFDNKGRLSAQRNGRMLNVLQGLQDELPSISQLEVFVKAIDTHLLMVISKSKSSKIMYKQWVRNNAKLGKTLLGTMKRSAKKQNARTSKPQKTKVAALVKPPTKRKPETIELEDNPKAAAKRAMARKTSAASAPVPGAAAVSEEGPSAVSARAPTQNADGSGGASSVSDMAPRRGGASSASDMAPPSCTRTVASDPDAVEEMDFAFKCKGEAVIEVAGEVQCMICRLPIKADDLVVVDAAEKVRHDSCLSIPAAVERAGKVAPLKPYKAKEIKKEQKAKRAATAAARKKAPLPGVSDDAALKRHNELMYLSKTMAKIGDSKGDMWRVRYEPTKRGSWLNTRHAVVLRWASGTCKTHQFDFSEMAMDDKAFKNAFEKALSDVVKSETE